MAKLIKKAVGIRFAAIKLSGRVILCAVILLILTALSVTVWFAVNCETEETFVTPMNGCIVVVDPGHGGVDSGAVANGAVEKELNLEISKLLCGYIEESGGTAILTRTDDSDTADPDRAAGTSWKQSDLKSRKADIENFGADMFVSIHMNKFEQEKYSGAQVFYTADSEKSRKLGESIQRSMRENVEPSNTREAKPSKSTIYVLKGNTVPSALVECGFLSNAAEAEKLMTPEYRRLVAWGIYIGIVRYCGEVGSAGEDNV